MVVLTDMKMDVRKDTRMVGRKDSKMVVLLADEMAESKDGYLVATTVDKKVEKLAVTMGVTMAVLSADW